MIVNVVMRQPGPGQLHNYGTFSDPAPSYDMSDVKESVKEAFAQPQLQAEPIELPIAPGEVSYPFRSALAALSVPVPIPLAQFVDGTVHDKGPWEPAISRPTDASDPSTHDDLRGRKAYDRD